MLKKIFKFTPFLIVFMAQTPYNEIFSNISTYIPSYILEKLPTFIQDKSFDLYATIGASLLIVIFFVPLKKCSQEAQFLYKNLKKYCTQKKQNHFISFYDAIAKIIQQLDINKLWKDYRFDDYTIYPHLRYKKCDRIESIELLTIFALIQEGKLILYAHKIIVSGHNYIDTSHLPLQQILKEFFRTCDIYSKDTWMDNYTIIRNFYATEEYYVNVSMKRKELDCFIKEHKTIHSLTSKHIA